MALEEIANSVRHSGSPDTFRRVGDGGLQAQCEVVADKSDVFLGCININRRKASRAREGMAPPLCWLDHTWCIKLRGKK